MYFAFSTTLVPASYRREHTAQSFARRTTRLPWRTRLRSARWTSTAGVPPPPPSGGNINGEGSGGGSIGGIGGFSGIGGVGGMGSADRSHENSREEPSKDLDGRSDDGSRDSEFNLKEEKEKNELFEFVKSVPPPDLVKRFTEAAPAVVQSAIRQTLVRMLGNLPPLAFSTNVSTMSSNLVQLFHSCLISGYMFRNAAYRLELTRNLDTADRPALPQKSEPPKIVGGVAVFKNEDGKEVEVPVEQYVTELRDTVNSLRSDLERERKGGNELLSFLSTMDPKNLEALTENAGEEVIDAMKRVVGVVTAAQGINEAQDSIVQASTFELGQLLFYLMVSGFFLREAEVRVDLQRKLGGDGPTDFSKLLGGGSQ